MVQDLKREKFLEAARDANLPISDNEDEDPFGEEDETPGEASQAQAGDFSVITKKATKLVFQRVPGAIAVNAEINPNAELVTPATFATFVISASQVPATPNRSMRVPEDSFIPAKGDNPGNHIDFHQ